VKIIYSLTVAEGKWLIAKAIAARQDIKKAYKEGKILLKGGTTVSAISEELVGIPLRISGRIAPNGLRTASKRVSSPSCLLLQQGVATGVDDQMEKVISELGADDFLIVSANIFDSHGRAAIMFGSSLGGAVGKFLSSAAVEGARVLIAVGLEKLSPGSVDKAILNTGRKKITRSTGMNVGMLPLVGEIFTEIEAIKTFGDVSVTIIGRGGIGGAEGATTFLLEGSPAEIDKVEGALKSLPKRTSGVPESMEDCSSGGGHCINHLGCRGRRK
jgi:hypothetical protein